LLNLASTGLCAEGTKLLAAALKGNQIMTELNISSNSMTYGSAWGGISGVVALADVIPDMRALSKLDVRENDINAKGKSALTKAAGVGFFQSRCVQLKFLSFF
jgi:hypothetical protein